MVESKKHEKTDQTEERLAEILLYLRAVIFSKEDLAIQINKKNIHFAPQPSKAIPHPEPTTQKGKELSNLLLTFTGSNPANSSAILRWLIPDIENKSEKGISPEELSDLYPDRPDLVIPKSVKFPDDICPIINTEFSEKYPLGDRFMVLTSALSPARLWIIPENQKGESLLFPKLIQIDEMDRAWEEGRSYVRYAYFAGSVFGTEYYAPINTRSGRKVIWVNWQKNNPPRPDESYDFVDERELFTVDETHDHLSRKPENYPPQTREFKRLMYGADFYMRNWIDSENISQVIALTDAIHRHDLKNGRQQTRQALQHLRSMLKPYILTHPLDSEYSKPSTKELKKALKETDDPVLQSFLGDINYDLTHTNQLGHGQKLSSGTVLSTFLDMLNVERCFLEAIYKYPWNNQGPEPFDALVEVLWFRYDFRDIANTLDNFKSSIKSVNSKIGEVYKKAWLRLRNDYVSQKEPDWVTLFASPEDVPVPAGKLRTYKSPNIFLDPNSLRELKSEKVAAKKKLAAPLGLTQLLWSTLKWAQPRPGRTILLDDLDYDPELADEHRPDKKYPGDLQGRIILSGEEDEYAGQAAHEETAYLRGAEADITARLLRAASNLETPVTIDQLKQIAREEINSQKNEPNPAKESAREFKRATAKLRLKDLMRKTVSLPLAIQVIIYARLGFNHPQASELDNLQKVIKGVFSGNSNLYYRYVRMATLMLDGDGQADLILQKYADEIAGLNNKILNPIPQTSETVDDYYEAIPEMVEGDEEIPF